MSLTIDGINWDYPCNINRVAEMKPSEISGILLDKSYFNDVIGTYMSYEVTVAFGVIRSRNLGYERDYYRLYDILNDPVDGHTLTLPYNDDEVTITGRIEGVQDVFVKMPHNVEYWNGLSFKVIANHPTKTYTLEEAITRGFAPLPPIGSAQIGDLYEYTSSGWEQRTYADADNIAY